MWPQRWRKIAAASGSGGGAASPATPTNPSFSFSTFKDIHSLIEEEESSPNSPILPKKSSVVFHRVRIASSALRTWRSLPSSNLSSSKEEEDKRIVLYYTSLRVVRKTFEDCRAVRSILRGFRVVIDERDLSMDSCFLAELKGILGKKQLSLPRVFIGGRYIGGAEEIQQLHESGELKKFVEGAAPAAAGVCDGCGGVRFVLCAHCNGSHKIFTDKGGFRTCSSCNENGLVRCLDCCSPAV